MENFKKLLSVILAVAMVFALAGCTGGETTEPTSGTEAQAQQGEKTTHTVKVQTAGGMALNEIDVYVYADNTLADMKDYGRTNENGEVTFGYDEATITYRDGTVETAHEGEMVSDKDHIYWGTRHACQIRQFYRACRGEEELEISGKAALPTHRLLFSLYETARKRGIDYTAKGAPAPAPVEEGKGIKIRYY